MKVTSISYQKTFNLGNYQSERLGVEVEVGEHEYADELMKEAKELVEKMHRDGNPGLYEVKKFTEYVNSIPSDQVGTQVKDIPQVSVVGEPLPQQVMKTMTPEEKKKASIQNYIEVIKIARSEKALSLCKAMVDRENNPELTEAYNNKLATLTAQPIKKETA